MLKHCENCGAPLVGNRSFCERCGSTLSKAGKGPQRRERADAPEQAPVKSKSKGNSRGRKTGLIVAAVLVGVALVVLCSVLLVRWLSDRPVEPEVDDRSFPQLTLGADSISLAAPSSASVAPVALSPGAFVAHNNGEFTEGYEPWMTLNEDGSFSLTLNLGNGLGQVNGSYTKSGSRVVLRDLTSANVAGLPAQLLFDITDENTLTFGKDNPSFGLTGPGDVFARGEIPTPPERSVSHSLVVSVPQGEDPVARVRNGTMEEYLLFTIDQLLAAGGFDRWAEEPGEGGLVEVVAKDAAGNAFVFALDPVAGSCNLDRVLSSGVAHGAADIEAALQPWLEDCYFGLNPGELPF